MQLFLSVQNSKISQQTRLVQCFLFSSEKSYIDLVKRSNYLI